MEETFQEYNDYHDRGMMKWGGFILSEHSRLNEEGEEKRNKVYTPRPIMTEKEKQMVFQEAMKKKKRICIQTTYVDKNGQHFPDVIGEIKGGEDGVIYVGQEQVELLEIRNVFLLEEEKWWASAAPSPQEKLEERLLNQAKYK